MPILGERLSNSIATQRYDYIIIGSGISGLCCATFLSKMGKKVLVLEKHYTIGGLTHTFKRKGYEWDVGLHYVGDVHQHNHPFRAIFDYITESELKWTFMGDEYDRLIFPDQIYSPKAGIENYVREMILHFPSEANAIRKYVKLIENVSDSVMRFYLAKNFSKVFRGALNNYMCDPFLKFSNISTYDALKTITSNEKLIAVLTAQYGDYGLPPKKSSFAVHGMVAFHYIKGGNYPIGGSSEIAKKIVNVINKNDGKVIFNANVIKVIVRNNVATGVELDSGEMIFADNIISSAGMQNTYNELLSMKDVGEHFYKKVKTLRYSTSALGLNIGLKESANNLNTPKSNLWIYPSYDHDKNINEYFTDIEKDLPITYVSFPSSKDPTFNDRFKDRSTISMLGAAPYIWFEKWEETKWRRRGSEYEDFKERFAQRYLDVLCENVPEVKGKIDYYEVSTPLSNKRFSYYQKGEIYGLEFSPDRFQGKWVGVHTPIKNLYLTGQDSFALGIAGALVSGAMTALTLHPFQTMFNLERFKLFR